VYRGQAFKVHVVRVSLVRAGAVSLSLLVIYRAPWRANIEGLSHFNRALNDPES